MTTGRERTPHPQEQQILDLLRKRMSNRAIAKLLYCGQLAVAEVRKAHRLPPAPRSSWARPHPAEREIQQLLREGYSDAEIRRRTGATRTTIAARRAAARLGPAPRPKPPARPHPRQAEILQALRDGDSNGGIARTLHVDAAAVARIRRAHNLPAWSQMRPSLEERWHQLTRETDDGHMEWLGPRANGSNTPTLRYLGTWHSAAAIAFRIRTGRPHQGQVKAECDVKHCVAPACVEDEPGRQALRLQLRRLQGLPDPPTGPCRNGHDLAVEGRLDASLTPYCEGCKRDRKRRRDQPTTS